MYVCVFIVLINSNQQALPDDLKTKLSIEDDMVSSPKEALSRASADRRSKYLNRYFSSSFLARGSNYDPLFYLGWVLSQMGRTSPKGCTGQGFCRSESFEESICLMHQPPT